MNSSPTTKWNGSVTPNVYHLQNGNCQAMYKVALRPLGDLNGKRRFFRMDVWKTSKPFGSIVLPGQPPNHPS